MNERIHERFIDHLMAGVEDIVGKTGNYNVRDKFKRFDNKFIRPLLIRDLKVCIENMRPRQNRLLIYQKHSKEPNRKFWKLIRS